MSSAFILHLRGTCVKGKAKVQIYILQKSIMAFSLMLEVTIHLLNPKFLVYKKCESVEVLVAVMCDSLQPWSLTGYSLWGFSRQEY